MFRSLLAGGEAGDCSCKDLLGAHVHSRGTRGLSTRPDSLNFRGQEP